MKPRVKFSAMSLEDNINIIIWAYFEKDGVISLHDYTVKMFPELENIYNYSEENIDKKIREVVEKVYDLDKINTEIIRYQNIWDSYNDKYFDVLEKYLDIKWINDKKEIDAFVGFIPIFPRDIDNYSFSLSTGIVDKDIIDTCAHEILHFLWFDKWMSLFPNTKREELNSPYLVWEYSEMVVDLILNSIEFNKLFNFNFKSYDYFYKLEYNGYNVMEKLRDIYNMNISIEDKIKKGYEYVCLVYKEFDN